MSILLMKQRQLIRLAKVNNIGLRRMSTGFTKDQIDKADKYCSDLVRQKDYNHYLISLFTPIQLRSGYIGLRAFNLETAMVQDTVSNTDIGKMKLTFWKDAVDNTIKGKPPHQPVALQLLKAFEQTKLSSMFLKRLVQARINYLSQPTFHTLDSMEDYAENTSSSMLYLHLELLSIRNHSLDHILSHLGKAIGITTLIKALPHHFATKSPVIPNDILAKHRIGQEQLFRLDLSGKEKMPEQVKDAVLELATRAHDHFLTAQSMLDQLQITSEGPNAIKSGFPVLLSAIPAIRYLKSLQSVDFNVIDLKVQGKDWKLPYYLWRSSHNISLGI